MHAVAYSSSPGTYILTGSADRNIRLYNPSPGTGSFKSNGNGGAVPEGRLIQTYSGHGYEVLSIDVSSSNESFVSCGGDRNVFLWDVSSGVTTRRFSGHSSRVNCVKMAGSGESVIVSGGFDTTVRLWDVKSSAVKPIQVFDDARDSVTSLAVIGWQVVAGSVDGRMRSYDIRTGKCTTDVIGGASVTSLWPSRDGKTMLVGSLDNKLRLMDRDSGACLRAYQDPGWVNEELRVQSALGWKDKYVVAGDEAGGKVVVWDLVSGHVVRTIPVAWGPDGHEAKRVVGRDGKEKVRNNVLSCLAWRDNGFGDQFCVAGTSGVVTVFDA